ncbi:hypothetical protein CO049_02405 [Candidatus Roizmanbacteria bacterium CG_4_9_14_0_2_um_filter_36_12]|uniref:Xaa-Pro dipeptidase n=1 Tax=Candidatus Roizmanbacteria bacterium CG_4_9_14_0_2_um_filter_36_12 TaxID=1974837 RepID=A0A2M8F019_9BACT|nr:MAG: hypothetical protein CO049_02405 [Candidatus Roizmanbacteria bacterium CG_4_9_14_0_2_um_filter_36_12]
MQQQKVEKLRKTLKEKGPDGFLVSNFYNILYLSGFKTLVDNEREAWMLVTIRNAYLFSDSRYVSEIASSPAKRGPRNDISIKLITPEKGLIKHLKEIVAEEKIKRLGIEGDDLKINEFNRLRRELINVEIVPTEKLIIKQRKIKDEDEIEKIKKACQITDECLAEIVKTIKVGQTEKEIAFKIELWLKEKSYDLAFYPIIAIDENSSLPHYNTRAGNNKKVKNSSVVLIDFGAKYRSYLSDITRMVFVGKPNNEMINAYNNLLTAQTKTIEKCNNKMVCKNLDSFCRQELNYPHSTGHGVGLEIHEYPKISLISNDVLSPNQIVTIEPGVYFENKWGMRVEDTVLIKEKGVEILTKFSKQPLIISN